MKPKETILITGGMGYVGSILAPVLSKDYKVVIVDNFLKGKRNTEVSANRNIQIYNCDIINKKKLETVFKKNKIDQVIHLAAIVGDPASKKNKLLTKKTNINGSKNILLLSKQYQIKKFIFFSTCSNYGIMKNNQIVNERSKLYPLSLYAKTKVKFEKILKKDQSKVQKIIFRISTLYGYSPRMRFDLTVNEFTKNFFLKKQFNVYHKDTWRPYIHLKDLSNVVNFFLKKKLKENVSIFNIGNNNSNFSKKNIIDVLAKVFKIKNLNVKYVEKDEGDMRNYKVNFSKLKKFKIKFNFNLDKGIKEIKKKLTVMKELRLDKKEFIN